jgi:6-phosphogluconate dehydrogenase
MQQASIGLIGLGVMGQNLALNFLDNNIRLAVYNRKRENTQQFIAGEAKDKPVTPCYSHQELVSSLAKPRQILLMITAGDPVDSTIEALLPLLDKGDIIIDGGNSHYPDTVRRTQSLKEQGILFVGAGISGGEEGARNGPAIMPGGNPEAWPQVKTYLQTISAKVDGEPCCQWIGDGGAGHYVKMVHNGIEYGDMQLIAEAYQFMREGLGLDYGQMEWVFNNWNNGALSSYLIEITRDIMRIKDSDDEPLLEKIQDIAGQKGTGRWTAVSALDQGVPLTLIGEAVFARNLSALKESRIKVSRLYPPKEHPRFEGRYMDTTLAALCDGLYAAKIISYAQGFMLMHEASEKYNWNLDYGNIALTWRGGCIIRSAFLDNIKHAYDKNPQLENLLMDDFFIHAIKNSLPGWRKTVQEGIGRAIPMPAFASALNFFDAYTSERTSANLLQAQRDYFGAHTYERIDQPRGKFFHTNWTINK